MPSRGTPQHSIRIPEPLWEAATRKAAEQGRGVSDVVRELLSKWIEGDDA